MDVRCVQCQAEYELDDTLVAERGTAVCCTRCGFRFRAYRPAGVTPAPECWTVRTAAGATLTFLSLRDLQEAIVLRRVGPQDALTRGAGPSRSLASIVEFRSLFEAAKRGGEALAKARPSLPTPAGLGSPSRPSMPLGLSAVSARSGVGAMPGAEAPPMPFAAVPEAMPFAAVPEAPPPARFDTEPYGGRSAPSIDTSITLPTGLPQGVLESQPTMPSMVRTIPFGEEFERPVRAAVEAALGRPIGPIEVGVGQPRGAAAVPGPSAGPQGHQVHQSEITAPLFAGYQPGRSASPRADGAMSAATPHAFVASEVVTPPDGMSRPPMARAIAGNEAARHWRGADGLSQAAPGAGGAQGDRRERGAGGAPWEPPKSLPAPPLRWFLVAAGALALVVGIAVRKGLSSAEQRSQAAASANAGEVDGLVASAEGALGRGDFDAASDAYAKAKALSEGDARVALGGAKAAVMRAEPLWWRLTLLPAAAPARAAARDELSEAAARAGKAVDEAAGVAAGDGRLLSLQADVRRLSGDLPAAKTAIASFPAGAAPDADATYASAALRLAEGAQIDAQTLQRLREASAAEPAQGRVRAALVYALALAGEEQAARAELDRLGASPGGVAALPELRAWLEARADKSAQGASGSNPAAPPSTAPKRRVRQKAAPARLPPVRDSKRPGPNEPGEVIDQAATREPSGADGAATKPAPAANPAPTTTGTSAPKPANDGPPSDDNTSSP